MKKIFSLFITGFALTIHVLPAAAQITPDGGTATTVSTNAKGQQTVQIAPNLPGALSYNSYVSFSVGTAGAFLDNTRVQSARTIVNEVTSAARSTIQGRVEVLGSTAHVILANPNGITVNGGSFHNTGGVVLGTGTISLNTITLAPGLEQTNASLTTNATGDVLIASGGLAGTMPSLQVYAGKIKIAGPVALSPPTESRETGDISLLAGKSQVVFDSSILPIAALSNWAAVTNRGTGSNEILVDVTSAGSLSASNVVVAVTEEGAGVSFAGSGLASAGEFRIDGSGKVGFQGAQVTASANLKAKGSGIEVLNGDGIRSELIAVDGALTLIAENGDLRNVGGLLQGNTRDNADPESAGGVTLTATGDITMLSENAADLAIAFSSTDDLVVRAGGDITNTAGRLLSNATTRIEAGGTLFNGVSGGATDAGTPAVQRSNGPRRWFWLWGRKRYSSLDVDYGNLSVPGEVASIVGAEVVIEAANVHNRGGQINANDGSVIITTPGAVTNEAVLSGAAGFRRSCFWFFCSGSASSTLALVGGEINATEDIIIDAGDNVTNRGGQWLALDDIAVTAPGFTTAAYPTVFIVERPGGLASLFQGNAVWHYIQDQGGEILASGGTIRIDTTTPVILEGGTLTAAAGLDIPPGIVVVRAPQLISHFGGNRIGLIWGWTDTLLDVEE